MKRTKVLLGLTFGLSILLSSVSFAQVNTGSKLVEIGPDNIGGRVTSLVVDQTDATHHTVYAGAATGGLFVRSNDVNKAPYSNMWNFVPCVIDGQQVVLPISHMVQGPDNMIYIATGRAVPGDKLGDKFEKNLAAMGQGLIRFNPNTGEFARIPNTMPSDNNSSWTSIYRVGYTYKDNVMHFFAATNKGLYRWDIASESDWNNEPICYNPESPITDLLTISEYNMVYFATYNYVYKIGNVSSNSPVNEITSNIPNASSSYMARCAYAPSDPSCVYVMLIGPNGLMEGVYLTKDQASWTKITTSTVMPFTTNSGSTCGALCVNPDNSRHLIVGGSSLWSGQGFSDGALYQWTKNSVSENEVYSGNYMADIYSNEMFVHSGINEIVATYEDMNDYPIYYVATDGGVYSTYNFDVFNNLNAGLNNIQVNGVAVCTDGSILAGASGNANIFIESRMAHHGGYGTLSWYDNHPELNTNHMGSVIFAGNGGQVAASMFQEYKPTSRRVIFTSSANHLFGRAFSDYADYTNTQTWTSDTNFVAKSIAYTTTVPQMCLWESDNYQYESDHIAFLIDTAAYLTRQRDGEDDTLIMMKPGTQALAGDRLTTVDRGHSDYPVVYTFPNDTVITANHIAEMANPLRSHIFIVTKGADLEKSKWEVSMLWHPTDFRKVFYTTADSILWAKVFTVPEMNYEIGAIQVSNNGDCLYVSVKNSTDGRVYVVRLRGIVTKVDYNQPVVEVFKLLNHGVSARSNPGTVLELDTIHFNSDIWFNRSVSSIAFDPRPGTDAAIVTFQDYGTDGNVLYITNASSDNPTCTMMSVANNVPAYSAMIEYTTGEVYIGTEDGIWVSSNADFVTGNPQWSRYGNFAGMPVTAMCQQTHELPVLHHIVHTGITADTNIYPRTKYPYAMYFGTYGRGIFMDSAYVTNHENEVLDPQDIIGIPRVNTVGVNSVKVYPNPATDKANLEIVMANAGNVNVRVYNLAGQLVFSDNLGKRAEGVHTYSFDCQQLPKGMYLINVISANNAASSKLIVR